MPYKKRLNPRKEAAEQRSAKTAEKLRNPLRKFTFFEDFADSK
jgi:hypothetical protein